MSSSVFRFRERNCHVSDFRKRRNFPIAGRQMNPKMLEILEFTKVRDRLGEYIATPMGRSMSERLYPTANASIIKGLHDYIGTVSVQFRHCILKKNERYYTSQLQICFRVLITESCLKKCCPRSGWRTCTPSRFQGGRFPIAF